MFNPFMNVPERRLTEMVIHGTAGSVRDSNQALLLLKEKNGDRVMPMLTSSRRAILLMARTGMRIPLNSPITVADDCLMLMHKFDIRLKHVEIIDVKDSVFFCNILAERDGEEHSVKYCNAADGLIVAVTAGCPIMLDEKLLDAQYMRRTGNDSFAININAMSRSMLQDAMEQAVMSENYEAASFLRDELRRREEGAGEVGS